MSLLRSDTTLAAMQMQGIKGNAVTSVSLNEGKSHGHSQYRRVGRTCESTDHLQRVSKKCGSMFKKSWIRKCSSNARLQLHRYSNYMLSRNKCARLDPGFAVGGWISVSAAVQLHGSVDWSPVVCLHLLRLNYQQALPQDKQTAHSKQAGLQRALQQLIPNA